MVSVPICSAFLFLVVLCAFAAFSVFAAHFFICVVSMCTTLLFLQRISLFVCVVSICTVRSVKRMKMFSNFARCFFFFLHF